MAFLSIEIIQFMSLIDQAVEFKSGLKAIQHLPERLQEVISIDLTVSSLIIMEIFISIMVIRIMKLFKDH